MSVTQTQTVARLLALALERGAIRYGDFTLSSGRRSSYYFDGRLLSLDPEGRPSAGQRAAAAAGQRRRIRHRRPDPGRRPHRGRRGHGLLAAGRPPCRPSSCAKKPKNTARRS